MKTYLYPDKKEWGKLLQRPTFDTVSLQGKVKAVLDDVKQNGDAAIKKYTAQFDRVQLNDFVITENETNGAVAALPDELKEAIQMAANNINTFHQQQTSKVEIIETMPGIRCWRKNVGIEKVGLYIPGGTAPLFSTLLMLAIPAKIAGCKNIIVCTPANENGKINSVILFV